jgi:hypothetical protein
MDVRRDNGIAIVVAVMAMLLMAALGVVLILTTSVEVIIAGNFRRAAEGLYAADGVLERAIGDLLIVADWNPLLDGTLQSSFIDGSPGEARTLLSGTPIDLNQMLNMANCQKSATCTSGDMDAVTAERPWGANNPRWQLYAYGALGSLLPAGSIRSEFYGVVMVADDPSENDGDPLRDGAGPGNPGAGVLALRAEAFGPRGAHTIIEMTVARPDAAGEGGSRARVLSWRQVR